MHFRKLYKFDSKILISATLIAFISLGSQLGLVGGLLSLAILLYLPGVLITRLLKLHALDSLELFLTRVGLSISFVIITGLLLNTTHFVLGIQRPLNTSAIIITFTLLLIFLLAACKIQNVLPNYHATYMSSLRKFNFRNIAYVAISSCIPIVSILGALRLNNGGDNLLSMITLGMIIVISGVLLFFNISVQKYSYAIYSISLGLLLLVSLRGSGIIGHDIFQEYRVFMLTYGNGFWDLQSSVGNPYNACLSITILPTILSRISGIDTAFTLKLTFQLIFATLPVVLFALYRKVLPIKYAFLAVFYFISVPIFFTDFPFMIRQEMALLFFALTVLFLTNTTLKTTNKNVLVIIFSTSMILSHYSTSYVALIILSITSILAFIPRHWYVRFIVNLKTNDVQQSSTIISPRILLILFLVLFFWVSQISDSASNIQAFGSHTFAKLNDIFDPNSRADQSALQDQFNISFRSDPIPAFNNYLGSLGLNPFDDGKTRNTSLVDSRTLPLNTSYAVYHYLSYYSEILKKLFKVFVSLGLIALLFLKAYRLRSSKFVFVSLGSFTFLLMPILLPAFTSDYSISRAYQQSLIALSAVIVTGALFCVSILNNKIRLPLLAIIFIGYFAFSTSFIPQIIGGFRPELHLNNDGIYYDKYYAGRREYMAAVWLAKVRPDDTKVDTSDLGLGLLQDYAGISRNNLRTNLIPELSKSGDYVFLLPTQVEKGINLKYYDGKLLTYSVDVTQYDNKKNLIYSNEGTRVYH